MTDVAIHQAILLRPPGEDPRTQLRSPAFDDAWIGPAVALCRSFGARPDGIACPAAAFARPLDRERVAVVEVRDAGADLRFRVLVMRRDEYGALGGDPFAILERFPEASKLNTLSCPALPLTTPSLEPIRELLQRTKIAHGSATAESPTLLGGVQVLVDGGRLIAERGGPDPAFVRALWMLLPFATRPKLWPASFAFSTELDFDVLVVPHLGEVYPAGYTTEEQVGDYPAGSYELALQIAVEAGDEPELFHVLRRSPEQPMRLGFRLLIGLVLLAIGIRWLLPTPAPDLVGRLSAAAGIVGVGDPWTVLPMLEAGNRIYGRSP